MCASLMRAQTLLRNGLLAVAGELARGGAGIFVTHFAVGIRATQFGPRLKGVALLVLVGRD